MEEKMKTLKLVFIIVLGFIFVFIIMLLMISVDIRLYKRIGDTNFYLVESVGSTVEDGKTPSHLYYRYDWDEESLGEGLGLCGFPKQLFWNDKHLCLTNITYSNGQINDTIYYIIEIEKRNELNIYKYETEAEFKSAEKELGLDESKMNHTDDNLPWSLHIFD